MLKVLKKICLLKSDIISKVKIASVRVFLWSTESLLRHILIVLAIGLFCFTVLGALWAEADSSGWSRLWANWRHLGVSQEHADRVKLSLTAVGGIGGTVYLVIKYRERNSIESSEEDIKLERIEEKILRAVQQLGSESPQVRIAGVYALTEVADTHRGNYRQRVVDLLCGYLRTERGSWDANTGSYVNTDSVLDDIILNVISQHMRRNHDKNEKFGVVGRVLKDEQLWCDCTINLRGAVITEKIEFTGLSFDKTVDLRGAIFQAEADFGHTFFSDVDFSGASFLNDVTFANSRLKRAKFHHTKFDCEDLGQYVRFDGATFAKFDVKNVNFSTGVSFDGSSFLGRTIFKDVKSKYLNFNNALLCDAHFELTEFKEASFISAIFFKAHFEVAEFANTVPFRSSKFKGAAVFSHVEFKKGAFFNSATFNRVDFTETFFHGRTVFDQSTFPNGHNLFLHNFDEKPIGLGDDWLNECDQEGGDDTENDHDDE